MITVNFCDKQETVYGYGLWQWDYGQVLQIQGLSLPKAVEIHFGLQQSGGETITRIGTTQDGVTRVVIPESMLETEAVSDYHVYAWIYLTDAKSGETVKMIALVVQARPKPEGYTPGEEGNPFDSAVEAVNEAADRAEEAAKKAEGAAQAVAPEIGENGNWYVLGEDTGKPSRGEQGIQGETGKDGEQGPQGPPGKDAVVDPTLTQSGQAADAKVTGDNLSMLSDAIVSSQSGEEIQLRDSSNRGLEGLKVYGKATQQRTTGAQLLDCYSASVEGVNTSYTIDKNEITVSGTVAWSYASYNITDFKGQQITVSGEIVGGENARVVVAYVTENDPAEKNLVFIIDVGLFAKTATIPTDATLAKIKLYANASNSTFEKANDCVYKNIMLNTGSTTLPWEPYTGGQSSPSLEYPQEITVSGDSGEIGSVIMGAQLVDAVKLSNIVVNQDGYELAYTFTINRPEGDTSPKYADVKYYPNLDLAGKTIVLAIDKIDTKVPNETNYVSLSYMLDGVRIYRVLTAEALKRVIDIPQNTTDFMIQLIGTNLTVNTVPSGTYTTKYYGFRLLIGDTDTGWSPYQSQSLVLSTPNGLPGIPVDTGGNYTDADGQQWVCDEIDLAAGVRRQRIGVETLTSVQMASEDPPPEGRFGKSSVFGTKYRDGGYPAVCNKATWASWAVPKDNV